MVYYIFFRVYGRCLAFRVFKVDEESKVTMIPRKDTNEYPQVTIDNHKLV